MGNKVLSKEQISSFQKMGIDPFSDTKISYQFAVSVSTKRLKFFEMYLNKFLGDTTIFGSTACLTKKTEDSIIFYKKKSSKIEELQCPTRSYESILVESVPYTRIKFEFLECNPIVVAKVITDLTDSVKIYYLS